MGDMRPTKSKNIPTLKPHMRDLTPAQRTFVETLSDQLEQTGTVNLTQASRIAYPNQTDRTNNVVGTQNMNKPSVREAYIEELKERGLVEASKKVLKDATTAKKLYFTKEGTVEYPDHNIRLQAAKEVHKVLDLYPDKQIHINKQTASLQLYAGLTDKQLEKKIQEISGEIEKLKD